MLESLPEETTQLFIVLCTDTGPLILETEDSLMTRQPTNTGPSYLSYLAPNRNSVVSPTAAQEPPMPPSSPIKTVRPGDAPSRGGSIHDDSRLSTPPPATLSVALPIKARPPTKYLSPRLYFPLFVDHLGHFVRFLETVALRRWNQSVDEHPSAVLLLVNPRPMNKLIIGTHFWSYTSHYQSWMHINETISGPEYSTGESSATT
jgi:hypothetical protein